ncbi:hypothetical protein LUW76_32075 [Actinomadura madurae]|uniref:hypothetical protein n=1 Tax=Actinomadura madurae TaxID=1993 RepID=UPI002026370A|nr:hypothetical protein [Actinomadura madurae]URM98612.1 hypothetical protein LUW76_32075 [Actinomadura madurae]
MSWSVAWLVLTGVIAFSTHPDIMVVAWGGIGFVGANVNVALNLYQAWEIDQKLLARVASASSFISRSSAAAGALCAGYIVAHLGPERAADVVFGLMAVLVAVVVVIIYAHRLISRDTAPGVLVHAPPPEQSEQALEPVSAH